MSLLKINFILHYLQGKFVHSIPSPYGMSMCVNHSWYDGFSPYIQNTFKRGFCISIFDLYITTQIQNITITAKKKNFEK